MDTDTADKELKYWWLKRTQMIRLCYSILGLRFHLERVSTLCTVKNNPNSYSPIQEIRDLH